MRMIYMSVMPFIAIMVVALILFMLFPEVILWLPNRI
jgi:TRAP-type mannitol/chloroaromatic compound transport system permease large subunit